MLPCHEVLWFPSSIARHWLETCSVVVSAFAAASDPRPDLAVPARSLRTAYAWWW